MPTQIKSVPGLKNLYDACPKEIQDYFRHIPKLLDLFPMDVCLAYVFSQLELGQNMAIYCGVVKLHKANAELARRAVSVHHMTRDGFLDLYKTVFDFEIPASALKDFNSAAKTRDKIMHGKTANGDEIRNAIARVLEFADEINKQLQSKCGFKPYGPLRGFSGRMKKLDKQTTRFMLKGMGFGIS